MNISISKTGKVRVKVSRFTYKHQLSLGDILTLTLLAAWFAWDVYKGVGH